MVLSLCKMTHVGTSDLRIAVLAFEPDGTQLFLAWYDRRNDTNNAFMEVVRLLREHSNERKCHPEQ